MGLPSRPSIWQNRQDRQGLWQIISTQNIHKISISVQLPPYKSMRLEPWNSETCPLTAQRLPCFLSWIGKHLPVSSSSIARWLKTCLSESGIDTSIFKAHSVRSASSSKAAASGITTADILQAADWSSESTFEKFYHRPTQDKSSYAKAVLSSAEASNLPC